jgi:hypothetical protein
VERVRELTYLVLEMSRRRSAVSPRDWVCDVLITFDKIKRPSKTMAGFSWNTSSFEDLLIRSVELQPRETT